ncbi:DUF4419 domain protein [Metarhizium robertsii]|uniref:DUF4419 domain protein n=2 Tax=Metarhizium robertsii TaxID=568076 RepID=E9FCL5_METRA|nr:uncharacterized protein MAA_10014 [Metarhizium robertsii ARSEF 23]EFY94522.1 hypothetical protein MAA_10014 [Metarhizium robertsii ARSEF 23]EXU95566.1 DUF4419 domain protein [Metarhizium robertsii]
MKHLGLLLMIPGIFGQVTIPVSDVEPQLLEPASEISALDFFKQNCPQEVPPKKEYSFFDDDDSPPPKLYLLSSSYSQSTDANKSNEQVLGNMYPSSSSFVHGAMQAWARHQNLVLRPDIVWFEILAQLNFYMNRHANDPEIRKLFVNFDGKKQITIDADGVETDDMPTTFVAGMQQLINPNVIWLQDWITPGFTTSTRNDNITAAILTMGIMQHYFEYLDGITCGIPSVTLLGTRSDWNKLYKKLDHLADFGTEPAQFASNLKPIIKKFIQTWDESDSPEVKAFWNQIVTKTQDGGGCDGSGAIVSGWITGFIHWTSEGALYSPDSLGLPDVDPNKVVRLDGIEYNQVPLSLIPVSYATAPIQSDFRFPFGQDSTQLFALAGNIGIKRTISSPIVEGGNPQVLAEPLSSWFIYRRTELGSRDEALPNPGLDGFDDLTGVGQCSYNQTI